MIVYGLFAGISALSLATSLACAQSAHDAPIVMPLVGRTLSQVGEKVGRPIEAVPLHETGGKLLIFETPRGDRYIIETDVSDRVVDAAVKHPENR